MKRINTDGIGWHKTPDELKKAYLPGDDEEGTTQAPTTSPVAPNEAE